MQLICVGAAALVLVGCANGAPDAANTSEIAAPTLEPETTPSPNFIQADAEAAYRQALLASQASSAESGLTELWFDIDGTLVQIAVQDPKSKVFASEDVTNDSVYEIDESSMMPARSLAELDGLISGGVDQGSVISNAPGVFVITNTIDLSVYVTTYTLDSQGRIAKSVMVSDDEPIGEINFSYSITKEGKATLATLSDAS
ncbi:unannotated protein [freshwater metagenome]|uniref:Unannotated protein n=1 Tax=freshwater metagenome TaxID=449393 RepID=A0A6J6YM94_9ZZZZ|nr:hypothetical protein [Actinomycetota bacterium]MSX29391.1 hypothetical protein [Actinomycetota bacterium]MSX97722.1 hypothetical protein [Actinomycetota bacterium]MSZ78743.1 hypothetical protein [Actinomycetota bacterium]MTB09792.1 hypothetical protein [Actinomycetota bacterium]